MSIFDHYQDRFAKQGTLAAGSTVFVESDSRASTAREVEVVRVTKVTVTVRYASGTEDTFRWNPSRGHGKYLNGNAESWSRDVLLTEEAGREAVARIEKEKATGILQAQARVAAEKLTGRKPWMTADDIDAVIAELQAAAEGLRKLG